MTNLGINKHSSLILLLCFCAFAQVAEAFKGKRKADKETVAWRYELEAVATGIPGTYQVKVWSYSNNAETATEQTKKNAIHGIIFKGFPSSGNVQGQKPLSRQLDLLSEHEVFFDAFFKTGSGDYMKFVSLACNGQVAPEDRIKIGKKEYKVGVVVTVNVAELRLYLERNEIIQSLSNGF